MVAEYASVAASHFAPEGCAMLKALRDGFSRIGCSVRSPSYKKRTKDHFFDEVESLSKICEAGLVIAPDDLLYELTVIVERNTLNLGCSSKAVKICADKLATSEILARASINVPQMNPLAGPYIIKPRFGCGSDGVTKVDSVEGKNIADTAIVEKFIEGEHISVSIITGRTTLPLSVNKQLLHVNGEVSYLGNVTPHEVSDRDYIIRQAVRTSRILGCKGYIGIDMVLEKNGQAHIVDVNARPTTAVVSINNLGVNVSELILKAGMGIELPKSVEIRGKNTFLKADSAVDLKNNC
ncbi:MAG TPA: ATP-grasp domain-containing protein [Candidatus Acidoferrales bacterium]|nr:ATP-grasp domain-containing protein [Candidatus Acidoferrales bacterium]